MIALTNSNAPFPMSFHHGVRVAAMCNGVLLTWLYAVAAPTADTRARIPFLVRLFDLASWSELAAIAIATGLAGLLMTGAWSWRSIGGVALGAFFSLVLLACGLVGDLIPAGPESPPKYWLLVVSIAMTGSALWHARRRTTVRPNA